MRRVVLDAHAFVAWFGSDAGGASLRAEYEAGALHVHVPRQFIGDVLGLAAERDISVDGLRTLGSELGRIGFVIEDAPTSELASWLARGTEPRHAPYAALASSLGVPVITTDPELARAAASVGSSPA